MNDMKSLFEVLTDAKEKTCYLLFDRVKYPEAIEFWETMSQRDDVTWCELFRGTEFEYLADVSPLLIHIQDGSPGESLYYWLIENEPDAIRFGLVGIFTGSFADLAAHWRNWVTCIYPDQTQAFIRFYDPTVLPQWWPILTPAQQLLFQGAHHRLYLPAWDEAHQLKLQRVDLTIHATEAADDTVPPTPKKAGERYTHYKNATHTPQAPAQVFPLQLTQHQYDTLFHEQHMNTLIDTLHSKLSPRYAWQLSLDVVTDRFYEGLALADVTYPSASPLAKETFALYRFYLGDRFDAHPEFQRLLKHFPLRDAIGEFRDKYTGHDEALAPYQTPEWLTLEGNAELNAS